jgi:hypothetical protein
VTLDERRVLIAQYKAGVDEVLRALDGFPTDQLAAHPLPGKWSVAEIVHHLADSEMMSAMRLRKLLSEAHPILQAYDQDEWAQRMRYEERPLAPAITAFRGARETTAQLLDSMTDADWRRLGWHTESGSYHSERWLEIYAAHAHGHAAQIRRIREELGA